MERDLLDGQHRNPEAHPGWFTTAYFHRPEELTQEVAEAGFDAEGPIAVEGPGLFAPGLDEWLDDDPRRERLLRTIRRVECEPSVIGASAHLLVFGRRP